MLITRFKLYPLIFSVFNVSICDVLKMKNFCMYVIPFWDKLVQCQSYLSMQLQLPWLLFLGHRGLCDAAVSLCVCACVCHMNEPLEKSQNTHRHTQLWHTGSPPYPVLSHSHYLKQRGHKCETEPVKPGNTDTPRGSKVNRRLTLHSPAIESKAVS